MSLLEKRKQRGKRKSSITGRKIHRVSLHNFTIHYQFESRMLPISILIIHLPCYKLFLKNLPTRTKNFSLFPDANLNVIKSRVKIQQADKLLQHNNEIIQDFLSLSLKKQQLKMTLPADSRAIKVNIRRYGFEMVQKKKG